MTEHPDPADRWPRDRPGLRRTKALLAVGTASVLGISLLGTAAANANPPSPGRFTVSGTAPSWAVPARVVGPLSGTRSLSLSVRLRTDSAAATAFALAVSTPNSGEFGKFLTPRQWAARFGASPAAVAAVSTFLRRSGFTHVVVNGSRTAVDATATVAQAQRAFDVSLDQYSHGGQRSIAPNHDVSLPAAVGRDVTDVSGLSETRLRSYHVRRGPGVSTRAGKNTAADAPPLIAVPCSAYYGQNEITVPAAYNTTTLPSQLCGYTPAQVQSAYDLPSTFARGNTGRGVTVAIIGAYRLPTVVSDLNTYSRQYGLPALQPGQLTENLPAAPYDEQDSCGGVTGYNEEEALDVEAVHSTAPGAKLVYLSAADCDDPAFTNAYDRLLYGNGRAPLASVFSESYGDGPEQLDPAALRTDTLIFAQAAAEGISVLNSSGDSGDEAALNDGVASPDFPASSPLVTAVGGTSTGIGANGKIIFQTGWEQAYDPIVANADGSLTYGLPLPGESGGGSGGGTSSVFAEPGYQRGAVPAALAYAAGNGRPGRVVPDIAALADPDTGFVVALTEPDPTTGAPTYTPLTFGGTSLSAPLTAGMVALADAARGRPLGFLNPLLYSSDPSVISDVQAPNPTAYPSEQAVVELNDYYLSTTPNEVAVSGLDKASTLLTAYGYDDVTGLGSPTGGGFVSRLARR